MRFAIRDVLWLTVVVGRDDEQTLIHVSAGTLLPFEPPWLGGCL